MAEGVREVETSSQKYKCGTCDAPIEYDAKSGALKCAFCGAEKAIAAPTGNVVEHALHEAALAKHKGYGRAVRKLHCDACGASISFDAGVTAAKCPFCASPKVAEATGEGLRPESLLPFKVTADKAGELFKKWITGLWFRPNDLKKLAEVKEIRGVYLPFFTYDAQARSWWTAERGDYYYENETYTAQENGRSVTKTRRVQKTRWSYVRGSRSDFYDDHLVYASLGLPKDLVKGIEPYSTGSAIPYTPEYLVGWAAEEAGFTVEAGWHNAQGELSDKQRKKCSGDVGGDTQRNLSVTTNYSEITFKHALLPAFVSAYQYKGKVFRFLVNGETGKTDGHAPLSWPKIIALVVAILAVIGIVVAIANAQQGGSSSSSSSSSSSGSSSAPSRPSSPVRRR